MTGNRRLTLRRESLTELAPSLLRGVAGATHLGCKATDACTHGCQTLDVACPSYDAPCPSAPVTDCLRDSYIVCTSS